MQAQSVHRDEFTWWSPHPVEHVLDAIDGFHAFPRRVRITGRDGYREVRARPIGWSRNPYVTEVTVEPIDADTPFAALADGGSVIRTRIGLESNTVFIALVAVPILAMFAPMLRSLDLRVLLIGLAVIIVIGVQLQLRFDRRGTTRTLVRAMQMLEARPVASLGRFGHHGESAVTRLGIIRRRTLVAPSERRWGGVSKRPPSPPAPPERRLGS